MLGTILDVWRSLTDPDRLIHLLTQVLTGWLGYAMLAGVVFAETGLLVGLFLPGDSLLFTVGVVCGAGDLDIVKICALLVVVSILGDQSGYFLGLRTGPKIFSRPDSRFFKQEYVRRTQAFYAKHGVDELVVVDPRERHVHWLGLVGEKYQPLRASGLIELGPDELAAQIDWPSPAP